MRPSVSYEEYRKRMYEDEEFKKVWDEMRPEFEIMRAIADGRMNAGMSQSDLADKADIIPVFGGQNQNQVLNRF